MSKWEVVPNPDWAGRKPEGVSESLCHDRSPFVEVQCSCGAQQHFHETDIKKVPIDADIGSTCTGCGELLVFDAGVIPGLFARLRREGWIT